MVLIVQITTITIVVVLVLVFSYSDILISKFEKSIFNNVSSLRSPFVLSCLFVIVVEKTFGER